MQPDLNALKHATAQQLFAFDSNSLAFANANSATNNNNNNSVESFKQPSQLTLTLFDEKQVERAAREWKSQIDDAASRALSAQGNVGGKVIEAAPVSIDERRDAATSNAELERARVFLSRVATALRTKPTTFESFLATMDEFLRDRNNTIDESATKLLAILQTSAVELVPDFFLWLPKSTSMRLQKNLNNRSTNTNNNSSTTSSTTTSSSLWTSTATATADETLTSRLARFTGEQFQLSSSIDTGFDLMQLLADPLSRSAAGADAFPLPMNNNSNATNANLDDLYVRFNFFDVFDVFEAFFK